MNKFKLVYKLKKRTIVLDLIYSIQFISTMILMSLFSNVILSHIVNKPFVYMDYIEDILERNDINSVIIADNSLINQIEVQCHLI